MKTIFAILLGASLLFGSMAECPKNPNSCHEIGLAYLNGEDLEQNLTKAYNFFKLACDKNVMKSCFSVGLLLDGGFGIKKNKFN